MRINLIVGGIVNIIYIFSILPNNNNYIYHTMIFINIIIQFFKIDNKLLIQIVRLFYKYCFRTPNIIYL